MILAAMLVAFAACETENPQEEPQEVCEECGKEPCEGPEEKPEALVDKEDHIAQLIISTEDVDVRAKVLRNAVLSLDQQLDQLISRQIDHAIFNRDIADANATAPIFQSAADLPLVMVLIDFIHRAVSVLVRLLTLVRVLKTNLGGLRVDTEELVQRHDKDGGHVAGRSFQAEFVLSGDHVMGGRRLDIQGIVASSQAREAFRMDIAVTVENGLGHLICHGSKERLLLRETPLCGVPVHISQIFIDFCVGFQIAARVRDLRGRGLGRLDALVQLTPRGFREARANGMEVAIALVALLELQELDDRVALCEHFSDRDDVTLRVETRCEID